MMPTYSTGVDEVFWAAISCLNNTEQGTVNANLESFGARSFEK